MLAKIEMLTSDVRIHTRTFSDSRFVKIQQKVGNEWKTKTSRSFALDIRVDPLPTMKRVAQQLNLIPDHA